MTTQAGAKRALVTHRKTDVKAADRREYDLIMLERAANAGEIILDKSGGPIGRVTAAQRRARLTGYEVRFR